MKFDIIKDGIIVTEDARVRASHVLSDNVKEKCYRKSNSESSVLKAESDDITHLLNNQRTATKRMFKSFNFDSDDAMTDDD